MVERNFNTQIYADEYGIRSVFIRISNPSNLCYLIR